MNYTTAQELKRILLEKRARLAFSVANFDNPIVEDMPAIRQYRKITRILDALCIKYPVHMPSYDSVTLPVSLQIVPTVQDEYEYMTRHYKNLTSRTRWRKRAKMAQISTLARATLGYTAQDVKRLKLSHLKAKLEQFK